MKGSKKVIISLSILSAVLVAVVISMAAVLASFSAVAINTFDVSYVAGANVKAEVQTEYSVYSFTSAHSGTGFKSVSTETAVYTGSCDTITFTGNENAETTRVDKQCTLNKAFEDVDGKQGKYDILVIHFTIKNNGDKSIKVQGEDIVDGTDANMIVAYASALSGTATTVFDSGVDLAAGATLNVYVQARINIYTKDANFVRDYKFTLSAV